MNNEHEKRDLFETFKILREFLKKESVEDKLFLDARKKEEGKI